MGVSAQKTVTVLSLRDDATWASEGSGSQITKGLVSHAEKCAHFPDENGKYMKGLEQESNRFHLDFRKMALAAKNMQTRAPNWCGFQQPKVACLEQ